MPAMEGVSRRSNRATRQYEGKGLAKSKVATSDRPSSPEMMSQGRWRRKAREERARAQSAQAEADRLRADLLAARTHNTALAIPDNSRAA